MAHLRTPPGWAEDPVAQFLDIASDNVIASFFRAPKHYEKIVAIDAGFVQICDNLLNPETPGPPLFLLQAHASYRGAAGLAMSGQSPQAFMVMRGCLENALYALYVHKDPGAFDRWLCRHDSEDAKKVVRKEFTIGRAMQCLEKADPKNAEVVSQLYDKTIDFGAHPNVAALTAALKTSRSEGRMQFKVLYLTAEPEVMAGTLKSVAQTGVACLLVFRNAFPERFDLLGITASLEELRGGL